MCIHDYVVYMYVYAYTYTYMWPCNMYMFRYGYNVYVYVYVLEAYAANGRVISELVQVHAALGRSSSCCFQVFHLNALVTLSGECCCPIFTTASFVPKIQMILVE